jgi:hypothetical protein
MIEEVCGISRENFISFCTRLKIPAKEGKREREEGEEPTTSALIPMELIRTQIYLLDEILEGLSRGIHKFFVLKCRQSGTTTLGLAFILYWAFKHDGMVFDFIADSQKRQAINRKLLIGMVKSLKDHPEWSQETEDNNRELISFANESFINWDNANSSDEGGLGRGIGLIGCWGTELGRWKDQEGVKSLMSALAKKNPVRFHCFEGTSTGPGLFKDYWNEKATGAKSIFIGWWLHPDYDLDLDDTKERQQYQVYWEGMPRLEREEAKWVEAVKTRYGFEVTKTQLAWWRYTLKEEYAGRVGLMYQEYPPLPEYAWQYGGKGFIGAPALAAAQNISLAFEPKARYFRFEFGRTIYDLAITEVSAESDWYDLIIWEAPSEGPFVRYAISMDPAYGASEDCDAAAIQVLRCYSDCAVQVAEWTNTELPAHQLAWVLLELAGAYRSETMVNIELQGNGYAVQAEIQRIHDEVAGGYGERTNEKGELTEFGKLTRIFGDMRFFLYSRQDSVRKSQSSYNWITTGRNKPILLETYRDFFERGLLEIRSKGLIEESSQIMRDPRSGRLVTGEQDHRLMAMAIALQSYLQVLETDIGGNEAFSKKRALEMQAMDPNDPEGEGREKVLDASPQAVVRSRVRAFEDKVVAEGQEELELAREQIETYSQGLPFIRHRS